LWVAGCRAAGGGRRAVGDGRRAAGGGRRLEWRCATRERLQNGIASAAISLGAVGPQHAFLTRLPRRGKTKLRWTASPQLARLTRDAHEELKALYLARESAAVRGVRSSLGSCTSIVVDVPSLKFSDVTSAPTKRVIVRSHALAVSRRSKRVADCRRCIVV